MAGNEWINGYLEAILDSRSSSISEAEDRYHLHQPSASFKLNLTRYFVEEVVIGVSETDLHRMWIKVVATRNTRERSSRLENMCWRIWHLARKNRHLELEESGRVTRRRLEREEGRRDATEELAEEEDLGLSIEEGSYSGGGCQDQLMKRYQRQVSGIQVWSDENREKKLYIVLISLHGLVRGENMELGRDSDTGGQVKYVVELSRALSMMPGVYRVDLLTRQISSPDVDWSYSEPTEMLSPGSYEVEDGDDDDIGESSGAYIIRIPCGPRDKYLSKELLWPYLQEFVDGALSHIINMSKALGDQIGKGHRPVWPYVIHGHYADAGDVATLLSGALNVPMVFTGHSLGRNKLEQLLKQGRQSEDINATYKILRRIQAEEMALDASELVITSTKQEIDDQWGLYDGFDVKLEKILRARQRRGVNCHGHYMPRLVVIPPGMDFSSVDAQEELASDGAASHLKIPSIWADVMRFLTNPHKPMILALSRPDPKKNITTLLKAFGECRPLRELANLTLIMGNRDDIGEMSSGNANVLMTALRLIDKYDLYGTVAYPKHHKQSDIPDIYRLAARTKGVFINPAFVEPFGLTLIEAAAHGLPIVATENGGPIDINNALNNGLLVDPHDSKAIADALLKLVADKNLWHECQRNGWRNIHLFSWPEHCRTYLTRVAACRMRHPHWQMDTPVDEISMEESLGEESLKDVQDLSLQLSFDGERNWLNSGVDQHELEKIAAVDAKCDLELQEQVKNILKQIKRYPNKKVEKEERNVIYSYPLLGRRRRLFVIAVDSYDEKGFPDKTMVRVIKQVLKGVRSDSQLARISGFALSTAMPVLETLEVLRSGKIQITDFDTLICSSGSEIYYPGTYNTFSDDRFKFDPDYMTHIEYRWGYHGVKNSLMKLMNSSSSSSHDMIREDVKSSNPHCISFLVKQDASKLKAVDDLRQKVRMRGLRCHLMYCRNFSRLHVVPLLASRSQALRYLFVRWGLNVANMYVILGDKGDTDREEMVAGCHKTIILKGVVQQKDFLTSERYWSESCKKEDMIPIGHDNPFIVCTGTGGVPNSDQILNALQQVSRSASLMS